MFYQDAAQQLCNGLRYMHSMSVSHNDLKPANIFYTKRADGGLHLLLADFGGSTVVDTNGCAYPDQRRYFMTSPPLTGPELDTFVTEGFTYKLHRTNLLLADAYSAGGTLCCMAVGRYVHNMSEATELLQRSAEPYFQAAARIVAAGGDLGTRKRRYNDFIKALGVNPVATVSGHDHIPEPMPGAVPQLRVVGQPQHQPQHPQLRVVGQPQYHPMAAQQQHYWGGAQQQPQQQHWQQQQQPQQQHWQQQQQPQHRGSWSSRPLYV
jgi:serine/threonine protein kinase